jgi:adenine-specific DNA-methyltransferase
MARRKSVDATPSSRSLDQRGGDAASTARLSGTVSLPFPEGEHRRIAVKVIDPRGNEVLRVHKIGGEYE